MMNSPWDPMSADSSRRSSACSNHGTGMNEAHPTPNIGQHLHRLHRRAQQQQMMQQTPSATPTPLMQDHMNGRGSAAMSDMTAPTPTNPPMPPVQMLQQQPGVRRASDPVRTLDRTFGVDGQLSRHQRSGSYNQLNGGPVQTRVPMHGARIRGMSGDTFFHQQQMPVSHFLSNDDVGTTSLKKTS